MTEIPQPIGDEVINWQPVPLPQREIMHGQYCDVLPLDIDKHAADLFKANMADTHNKIWTYLSYGPFDSFDTYLEWMQNTCCLQDPLFFVISNHQQAIGLASYLRIDTQNGVLEIGHLAFSPKLQRTRIATEALFLMIDYAFILGYRRVEWKCNALNNASRSAALRLGMTFEGIFRQTNVVKGHNRDTAWYSMLDKEWPMIKNSFTQWLNPSNFDENGLQKSKLSQLRAACHQ
jgi:RimJ/RimL family protein N-acetyltransferase